MLYVYIKKRNKSYHHHIQIIHIHIFKYFFHNFINMASLLTSMDLPSSTQQEQNNNNNNSINKPNLNINIGKTKSNIVAPKVPLSTPRRRLRQALDLEKAICQKLEQQGWTMIIRAGKKIGSVYALVTGYTKFPDVRLAVYQTNNSRIQEIIFKSEMDLTLANTSTRKAYINNYLKQYTFNEQGDLVRVVDDQQTKISNNNQNNKMVVDNDISMMIDKNNGSKTETSQEQQLIYGVSGLHIKS